MNCEVGLASGHQTVYLVGMAQRSAWFSERLYDMQSHRVDVDGCSINYVDQGTGPTLLMLHGNRSWSYLYRNMVRELSRDFRCVVPDLPGFGLSMTAPGYRFSTWEHARVIKDFVDRLDLNDVTLIAQGWGGPIGLDILFSEPERFSRLVLGNTWAWPLEREMVVGRRRMLGGPIRRVLHRPPPGRSITQSFKRRRPTPEEIRMYRGPLAARRKPTRVLTREATKARALLADLEAKLPRLVGFPSMLLWANADPLFTGADLEKWRETLKNRHLYILDGAGRFWPDDAGKEAAQAFSDWYNRPT